jgi:hypothetical protein
MVEDLLRKKLSSHFESCGVGICASHGKNFSPDKSQYRAAHLHQRFEKLKKNQDFIRKKIDKLSIYFADGSEVIPENIDIDIELVETGKVSSDIFRLVTLNWSIPVSEGYGRRLRFLVWDRSNNKVVGIFALGDAVFNIRSRDDYFGWSPLDRKEKLVNIMDAYVLGAIPPYSNLLCGKMIASLIKSKEVVEAFRWKYKDSVGLISKSKKDPHLTAVTVTSALGRSSIYNRLKLDGDQIFTKIGMTEGWGHFHVSNDIFILISSYLKSIGDVSLESYEYGGGPNWKIRIIKRALWHLGLEYKLMKHGFKREVYVCEIANNSHVFLRGECCTPDYSSLKSIKEISLLAKNRWIIPRSIRNPEFKEFKKEALLSEIGGDFWTML